MMFRRSPILRMCEFWHPPVHALKAVKIARSPGALKSVSRRLIISVSSTLLRLPRLLTPAGALGADPRLPRRYSAAVNKMRKPAGVNRRALMTTKGCCYVFFFFFVLVIGFDMLSFAPLVAGAVVSEPDFAAAPPPVPLAPPV
jgi:hypothetical protein